MLWPGDGGNEKNESSFEKRDGGLRGRGRKISLLFLSYE